MLLCKCPIKDSYYATTEMIMHVWLEYEIISLFLYKSYIVWISFSVHLTYLVGFKGFSHFIIFYEYNVAFNVCQ